MAFTTLAEGEYSGAVGAAIRRASQAARNGMEQLDGQVMAELERIYSEAADQVRGAILQAAAGGQQVRLEQLRGLLARIDQVLQALGTSSAGLIEQALQDAAELGVRPLTGEGLAATGRAVAPVVSRQEAAQQVDAAVRFVAEFRAADGLNLSDRIWKVNRGAREAVQRTIEAAVVQGWGAHKAAREFLLRGLPVPEATQAAQRASDVANVLRGADTLQDSAGGALAAAQRVARTEINRAHGEAYMATAAKAPGVVGFRFLLSPRHPRPDICDLYAKQNLHGLGPGVYPDRKSCPWPAHPNTLSFVVAVFGPEVAEADRAGRETTMQALERLGPEIRAGVLGPTKAGYFDQGLMSRGMVRSRVGDVRRRLERGR
ncbi:hypothetical protein [Paucibacter sp. B51]|uniref:hypothetical protein n=1 Tax=Paucibacter sp. B51 TaxID=2993315 RepID=UPI0022EBFA9D|nr:hypothetical protein [Paucibacter sp. B51]